MDPRLIAGFAPGSRSAAEGLRPGLKRSTESTDAAKQAQSGGGYSIAQSRGGNSPERTIAFCAQRTAGAAAGHVRIWSLLAPRIATMLVRPPRAHPIGLPPIVGATGA
jgi:hypothetical protein